MTKAHLAYKLSTSIAAMILSVTATQNASAQNASAPNVFGTHGNNHNHNRNHNNNNQAKAVDPGVRGGLPGAGGPAPAVGGASPATNPQVAGANTNGATNVIPS